MEKYIDSIEKDGNLFSIEGSVRSSNIGADYDLVFSDDRGHAIMTLKDGTIKTSNFDSTQLNGVDGGDNSDLELKDPEENTIVRFRNGSIETKNVKNHSITVVMEEGSIDSQGVNEYKYNTYNSGKRTAFFINTNGATELFASKGGYLYKYNSSHVFISMSLIGAEQKVNIDDCSYIRLFLHTTENELVLKFNGVSCPCEEKLVAMRTPSERLLYHVDGEIYTTALLMLPPNYSPTGKKVPLVLWDSGDGSFKDWDTYEMGTGYERRRIGLEYMRDQGFAVLEIYPWGSYYYRKYPDCGGRACMPIPTHLKCHEKGVEYVCSRYNIDADNIFEISKSGSGKISLYYAIRAPHFNLKSIYAMAPVFDDLNFRSWGMPHYKAALMEELELTGTEDQIDQYLHGTPVAKGGNGTSWKWLGHPSTESGLSPDDPIFVNNILSNQQFIKNNAEKFSLASVCWINLVGQTMDEKCQDTFDFGTTFWAAQEAGQQGADATGETCYTRYNLVMLGSGIPIKVIMAKNDEQTPYWNCAEVINQLKNGGCDATIYPLASQGHSAPDMGTIEQATDITTLCGQHYEAVSVGWYMACADIQKRYLAHIDKDVYDYING